MNKSIIKLMFIIIIIIYMAAYIITESGYYEYSMQQKNVITSEKIKEFEEDIKNNENIDLLEYFHKEEANYTNKLTKLVYNISEYSSKLTKKVIKKLFQKLGSMVE